MRKKFHGLKKVKVRQDWSKWTLYNLSRLREPTNRPKTYFQQKWAAKSLSRAYHGEQIREKQWQHMFRSKLPAVVPMNHRYLATHDGSEQATGRGSGEDVQIKEEERLPTPYMQMVYYPTERRLDTAIFRALFASSTRQARQFVVHGFVKVNGKKMIYPGYLLNPGDMFSVDPARVMWATSSREKMDPTRSDIRIETDTTQDSIRQTLFSNARILTSPSSTITTADRRAAQNVISVIVGRMKRHVKEKTGKTSLSISQQVEGIKRQLKIPISKNKNTVTTSTPPTSSTDTTTTTPVVEKQPLAGDQDSAPPLTLKEERLLQGALEEVRDNPLNKFKGGWRPKDYMSAFAFIPRFLEVNQNICSAVYLRQPVARPGQGEVPTPFSHELSQLAFNWYLRRR